MSFKLLSRDELGVILFGQPGNSDDLRIKRSRQYNIQVFIRRGFIPAPGLASRPPKWHPDVIKSALENLDNNQEWRDYYADSRISLRVCSPTEMLKRFQEWESLDSELLTAS